MMTAPLFSAAYIPMRIRLIIAVLVSAAVVPMLDLNIGVNPLGIEMVLLTAKEFLIGLGLGFLIQMIFEAITLAGHLIANGMGLGFAMMVDPQRGIQVPVLSQFLLIVTMLLFVVLNGHLDFLALLIASFETLPVAPVALDGSQYQNLVLSGTDLFSGAIRVAIPAVIALLVVQIAVGVISRAAPTMNLFAVGFPLAMLIGFLLLEAMVPSLLPLLKTLLAEAFLVAGRFIGV